MERVSAHLPEAANASFLPTENQRLWVRSQPNGFAMASAVEVLQRARLAQGVDLSAVAAGTKIDLKWLQAIEAGDPKKLPGTFFYRSFAHQYADFLGLERAAIDAEIDRLLSADIPAPSSGKESQTARKLSSQSRMGMTYFSYLGLGLVLVVCVAIEARWSPGHKVAREKIVSGAPIAQNTKTQEAPSPAISRVASASVSPVSAASAVGVPAGSGVRLDLTATEETWLSVSSNGTPVFTGLLAPNQTKRIESEGDTKLLVGNAAGLEVRLNGKPLGPLGAHGQVRVLDFRPDKLQFVPPPRKND
jgi:cytoskeleton protein RodZ